MAEIKIGEIVKGRVCAILPSTNEDAGKLTLEVTDEISGIIFLSEIGISMPDETITPRQVARRFMGRTMAGKVVSVDPLVLSNAGAVTELKKAVDLKPGDVFEGVVTFVNSKHAEIEYENCMLTTLYSNEYGWLFSNDLKSLLTLGQKIKVEVLEVKENRITVSHKKFAEDPRERLLKKYTVRGQYLGRVTKFIKAGVFVNLEPGLDVLASPYPFFELNEGDEVAIELSDIDINNGKFKGIITARALSA